MRSTLSFLAAVGVMLFASQAMAQTVGCQAGTSPATCAIDWSAGTGKIMVPSGSAVPTDCIVRRGTTTLFSGVVGVGQTVSFSVAALTASPFVREVTANCQNSAGTGATTFASVTFRDGRTPDAPVLQ
jgi:hypothetical protein